MDSQEDPTKPTQIVNLVKVSLTNQIILICCLNQAHHQYVDSDNELFQA